MVGGRQNLWSF